MVYILLVVEDYKRNELNIKSIESSLLSGVIHVLPENENKFRRFRTTQIVPVYSLESLLDFWQSYGFTLTRGVYEKPDHSYFMPSYLTIPMHWLTLEEVEEKEGKLNRDIPIYVKTYNYAKVNHINKEIQSGKEVGINIEIRDSEKIQPKENKEESNLGFKHSPDYRSLNLRGNLYKLTSRQAEVIQLLHEAHENETPSLGQDYILTKIGSKYSKLKDVFRSNPKVWKEIITTEGERRGSYRLNI